MKNQDQDNSNMFKVDHSEEYQYQGKQQKLDHFFHKDKKILNEGQPRKVLFGPMQQQPKTIYEIVQPYLWKMAQLTGQAATVAGKGVYTALSNGIQWVYDKLVNKVIPYTAQQIPKLLFIIKNEKKKQLKVQSSDTFHVLEIDENDYQKIKKKQTKKNKKRIIVPLQKNQDPQFIKFLQKQNFVPDTSFKIGDDSDDQQQTFMVPSATFMIKHNQAINKNMPQIPEALQQYESQQVRIETKAQESNQNQKITQQKINENESQKKNQVKEEIKSIVQREQLKFKQVQDYKRVQKKYVKLKDCFIFELQGKNSIEYDLLDGIQKDDNTKCGYLIKSSKFNIEDEGSSGNQSGQVPLITQKVVDKNMKVRVQIPTIQIVNKKVEEKQVQLV